MESRLTVITPRMTAICLSYTLIANTAFSIFMTYMNFFTKGFLTTFIFVQCIGISATLSFLSTFYYFNPTNKLLQIVMIIITMIFGVIVGSLLASVIIKDIGPLTYFSEHKDFFLLNLFYASTSGTIAIYLYIFHERISAHEALIQEERFKRLSIEKKVIETKLKLLEAQIEPHFLFNTLANILSLLDTDLEKGKQMMVDFISYLRTALSKPKDEPVTLRQSMVTIRAYLNIFKIRMGNRLKFVFIIPDELKDINFPPMLIQPLVENAIKHGLEPKVDGGEIIIKAQKNGDMLQVEVVDDGLGFQNLGGWGIGLSNVKERIESIYGNNGRFLLEENKPIGMKAIIEVPCGKY